MQQYLSVFSEIWTLCAPQVCFLCPKLHTRVGKAIIKWRL